MKIAKLLIEKINSLGYEAYFVGGSVRDYLLKRKSFDIDISTSATPEVLMNNFKAVPIGLKFGTVLIIFNKHKYEVTTFRKDLAYYDNRHPEGVIFSTKIEEDVQRRDFTINGLYMTKDFEIIDLVNGIDDLKNELITTIGNPDDRFREDALRMLRAFYLVSKLDFKIDKNTFLSIHKNKELIKNVSAERIYREIDKIISYDNKKEALSLLVDSALYKYLPGLSKGIKYLVDNDVEFEKEVFFPFCFFINGKVDKFWKLSNVLEKHYKNVIKLLSLKSLTLEELIKYNKQDIEVFAKINEFYKVYDLTYDKIINMYDELPITKVTELAINSEQLIEFYKKEPGPWIKDIQQELLSAIINKELDNNYSIIIEYLNKRDDNNEK